MKERKMFYDPEQVLVNVVSDVDSLENIYVLYATLSETQYYSPGVNVDYSERGDVYIEFPRASIRDDFPVVKIKAVYASQWLKTAKISDQLRLKISSNSHPTTKIIEFKKQVSRIYVRNGALQKLIWQRDP